MGNWIDRTHVPGMKKYPDEKPPGATDLLVKRETGDYQVAIYNPAQSLFTLHIPTEGRKITEFVFKNVIEWKTL